MFLTARPSTLHLFRYSSRRLSTPLRTIPNRALLSTGTTATSEQHFGLDPYNYTGGRWLCNENQELQLRHINFDFSALCQKILSLCNARSITTCEKIEGGSNRVFVFTLEDGQRTIAKLPFQIAGPVCLTTASEVATVRYLQRKTSIPIPRILDWSADAANDIGSEYIISEHASGTSLHFKWPDMTDVQRVQCIKNIYHRLKDIDDITFPAYGSIYFADTDLTSTTYSLDNEKDVIIGPHCGNRYWDCHSEKFHSHHGRPNQGPWLNMTEYSTGQIQTGLAKLPPSTPSPSIDPKSHLTYQGTVPQHLDLLSHAHKILHKMCADPLIKDYSSPLLFHPDLHKRNIFVSDEDPAVVTAIIDWQSSAVEPAFRYRWDVPDFAGMKLVRPFQALAEEEGDEDSKEGVQGGGGLGQKQRGDEQKQKQEVDEDEEHDHDQEKDPSHNPLTAKAYTTATLLHLPTLTTPKYIHENTFRPFVLPPYTWSSGLVNLQHELIELRKDWTGLGFDGECPFPVPTKAELEKHKEEYENYKTVLSMRETVCEALGVRSDGFVDCGDDGVDKLWDERVEAAREYCGKLRVLLEEGEEVEDVAMMVRAVWPFDVDL